MDMHTTIAESYVPTSPGPCHDVLGPGELDAASRNPCGEVASGPKELTTLTMANKDGPILSLRLLADAAGAPSLFNRVPSGKLMAFVSTAGWRSPGRRQYALSCAAKVEQWRLRKELKRGDARYDIPDQLIPWGTNHKAPSTVRGAAVKLQELAATELAGTFRDTASPETKAAFVDLLRGVLSAPRSGRTSIADATPANLPRNGSEVGEVTYTGVDAV